MAAEGITEVNLNKRGKEGTASKKERFDREILYHTIEVATSKKKIKNAAKVSGSVYDMMVSKKENLVARLSQTPTGIHIWYLLKDDSDSTKKEP